MPSVQILLGYSFYRKVHDCLSIVTDDTTWQGELEPLSVGKKRCAMLSREDIMLLSGKW